MSKKFLYLGLLALLGALVAFLGSFTMPPQWEAVATLRGGMVAGVPIESTLELVDRLRSPATVSGVSELIGKGLGANELEELRGATRISIIGSSIQLRVRAPSQDIAIKIVEAYFKVISVQQSNLLLEQIDALKNFGLADKVEVVSSTAEVKGRLTRDGSPLLIKTYPTQFSVKPAAFPKPVFPNRFLITLFGFLTGAIFWASMMMLRQNRGGE